MHKYNLGFISDDLIYHHVKETAQRYMTFIDLKQFNKNLIDPIKLTFDAKVYGKSFEELIESECVRQMDKTNTNHIGYFHQNLFRYAGDGWVVPEQGFDLVNEARKVYVEIKNKHNTMNAASSMATYMKMQDQLLKDSSSLCLLVEVIAKHSQNTIWKAKVRDQYYTNSSIRRVSIDKFYEIVFGDPLAFVKLCRALPNYFGRCRETRAIGLYQKYGL